MEPANRNLRNDHPETNNEQLKENTNQKRDCRNGKYNKIDEALGRFFFGCNISFRTVESTHFKNLMYILDPDYKVPSRDYLSSTLLDKLHERMIEERKDHLDNKDSVLLIDGWKNSASNTKQVTVTIHNADEGKQHFVESYNHTGTQETGEALGKVIDKATKLVKEKYNTNVFAVVSDNASNMILMGKSSDLWHATCNSHSGNLLAKSLVDKEFASKVNSLLKEFKNPGLQQELLRLRGNRVILSGETRWCSYRDSFRNNLNNLNPMRRIAADENFTLKDETRLLLQDNTYEEKLRMQIDMLDPVCVLVNKCQSSGYTLADATESWLTLQLPNADENLMGILEARKEKNLKPIHFAANLLHPAYRGQHLSVDQIDKACDFINKVTNLEGRREFAMYAEQSNIFSKLYAKRVDNPNVFWTLAKSKAPNLSRIALKLSKIPASSAQLERLFSNWAYVHSVLRNRLSEEKSKKLVDLYYSLRNMDYYYKDLQFIDPFAG